MVRDPRLRSCIVEKYGKRGHVGLEDQPWCNFLTTQHVVVGSVWVANGKLRASLDVCVVGYGAYVPCRIALGISKAASLIW